MKTSLAGYPLILLLALAAVAHPQEKAKKVLLIGIDGCRADAIAYSQAKHLKVLMKEGAFTDRCDVLGSRETPADTITGPGWSTALTGVFADQHGVKDNAFKDHKLADHPNLLERYEAARPDGTTAALVTWKPFTEHVFARTKGARLLVDGDVKGYEEGDRQVHRAAVEVLTKENPDIVFAYFGNVDLLGHGYGFHPKAYKYTNGIETVDGYVGDILAAMRARKTYADEDWLVIVCTDHGGQGRGHSPGKDDPDIRTGFLILHGPAVKPGTIEAATTNGDVAATALKHLGIEIKAEWKLDGKAVGLKE